MIDNSLLNTNFMGRDSFTWWIGQVAHPDSWKNSSTEVFGKGNEAATKEASNWGYRCKVRIIGYHPFDGNILEDKDLPWAHVMVPASQGTAQGGFGETPSLVGGECVIGFFLDGDEAQQPIIFGALHKPPSAVNLITEAEIAKEKSSSFRPFSGFNSANPRGSSQTPAPKNSELGSPNTQGELPNAKQNTQDIITKESAAEKEFGNPLGPITKDNGCEEGWLADITNAIRSFITTTNSLTAFLGAYVNAAKNVLSDLKNVIRKAGLIILGIIKRVLNRLREKFVKWIAKKLRDFLGLTVPDPQLEATIKAINKVLDIIFCIFEKLGFDIFGFITNLLTNMVGKTIGSPLCAAEQAAAAIVSKLLNELDKLLKPVLDGIDWLVGGLSQIGGVLNSVTSYANLILSFLDCDTLSCRKVVDWSSGWGLSYKAAGDISGFIDNITIMDDLITGGGEMTLEDLAAEGEQGFSVLTALGGNYSRFVRCNNTRDNPQTQDDIGDTPPWSTFPVCIPPKVEIVGRSKKSAKAYAVVASDGSILSIEIIDAGLGYEEPPVITVIDKTNHGGGADAECFIDEKGSITQIYLRNSGIGYCQGTVYYPSDTGVPDGNLDDPDLTPPSIKFLTPPDNATGITTNVDFSITFNEPVMPGRGLIRITESASNTRFATIDVNDRTQVKFEDDFTLVINPKDNLKFNTEYYIGMDKGTVKDWSGNEFLGIGDTTTYNVETKTQAGIGSEPVGVVTSVVVDRPGYGYTSGDQGSYGNCTFDLVLTPAGNVIGIKNINCIDTARFTSIPDATINTNTGFGAKLLPVIAYDPNTTTQGKEPTGVDLVIKVVDCPTRTNYG